MLLVGTYFFTPALYFPFLFSSGKETLLSDDELHFYWLMCGVLGLFFYFFIFLLHVFVGHLYGQDLRCKKASWGACRDVPSDQFLLISRGNLTGPF